jgi:hypothetical protein
MDIGEPIVATYRGWAATWHGGEYIDVFATEDAAQADARGEMATGVAVINTTGDTVGETREEWEAYVRDELMAWVRTDAADYTANEY